MNDTIRKITANGVVTTLAGMAGVAGSDDGVGSSARFWYPYGVAVDSGGNVFVADSNNYVIRKITPDGSVTTIGGTVRQVGSMDGVGSNASFGPVSGIAVDAGGNVYVADNSNSEIRVGSAGEPVITSDPQGAVITYGVGGTLSATAQGAITYQWCLNGTPIAGATADSYVATYGGNYTMSASNAAGSALSGIAVVTADSRLTNLSTRIQVGTGGNAAISGLVIAGLPGSTKQLLIRVVGPALAQFGLTGELVQPSLSVFDSSGGLIASNSAWGTPPVPGVAAGGVVVQLPTPTLMKAVGAFALPSGSADSAMVVTLPPGAYTAEISGVGGTTGLALAEIYEMNASDSAVLSNISTRADAGVGQNAAVGGFAVVGTQPATLLIRAIGPALSGFGVTGFLSQPALTVFDSRGAVIAMDLGWGVAPSGGDSTVNSVDSGRHFRLDADGRSFPVVSGLGGFGPGADAPTGRLYGRGQRGGWGSGRRFGGDLPGAVIFSGGRDICWRRGGAAFARWAADDTFRLAKGGSRAGSRTQIYGFGGHHTIHCATPAGSSPPPANNLAWGASRLQPGRSS